MWQRLAIWALLLAGIVCLAQQTPTSAYWQTRDSAYNDPVSSGAVSYVGPQSVVTGAKGWWGSSGYTNTDTANAWNVCNVSDVVCTDWAIGANGYVTPALVGGSNCGVVTCTIKIIYDRSGGNACLAATPCDFTQATIANRATVLLNALGTFACASMPGTAGGGYVSTNFVATINQPYTMLAVSKRTGATTTTQGLIGGAGVSFGYLNMGDTIFAYAGSVVSVTNAPQTADGAFHSLQVVFNTPTSTFYTDGVSTSPGDPANDTLAGGQPLDLLTDGAHPLTGIMCDVGLWPSAFSGTNQTNMNTNRHAAYGTW
jgi:hypothetical protein